MKGFIFVLFFYAGLFALQAQNGLLKRANYRYDRLAYRSAIPLFERYYKNNPRNQEVKDKLAESYRLVNDPEKAEYWYNIAIQGGETDPVFRFHYANAIMNNGRFHDAEIEFLNFLKLKPNDSLGLVRLESCRNYLEFLRDSNRYEVRPINVNTSESDFSPGLWKDEVVFASSKAKDDLKFSWLGNNFLDLYHSKQEADGNLNEIIKFKGTVNSKFHEAGATFTDSGDTMYFTRNNYYRGKLGSDQTGTTLLQTYVSEWNGKNWKTERKMNFNSDDYSTGHPALFDQGNKMIIVSDMPGGQGGTDLYLVKRENGVWGKPENLGPGINSKGNEMFPWVDSRNTLYFGSNGHKGLGGLDIFRAKMAGNSWVEPLNMGYPINTPMDDFGMVFIEEKGIGYFSSNRAGGKGIDDIYYFDLHQLVVVKVKDENTGEDLSLASVDLLFNGNMLESKYSDAEGDAQFKTGPGKETEFRVVKDNYLDTLVTVDPNDISFSDGDRTDTDGDGIPDAVDLDDDNDGILDSVEGSDDFDGDGIPNSLDLDTDDDGLLDINETVQGKDAKGQNDQNRDGMIDGPVGKNGIPDAVETSPDNGESIVITPDFDLDGKEDYKDIDSDGDGIPDLVETGGLDQNQDGLADGTDPDQDGIKSTADKYDGFGAQGDDMIPYDDSKRALTDADGDGIDNEGDIDDDNDGILDLTEGTGDYDGDGVRNSFDLDCDNDGIPDLYESDLTPSQLQSLDKNGDGIVDGPVGKNGLPDLAEEVTDNGRSKFNMPDTDHDNKPDYKDLDSDNDGISDVFESLHGWLDANHNGIVDGSDTDGDGIINRKPIDTNSILGGTNAAETFTDADDDGVRNTRDLDSDNDGILDVTENRNAILDKDNNGIVDGTDTDNDGIVNTPAIDPYKKYGGDRLRNFDSDGDGIPDAYDSDSDNDGISDFANNPSGFVDANNDGKVDGTDTDEDGVINFKNLDENNFFGASLKSADNPDNFDAFAVVRKTVFIRPKPSDKGCDEIVFLDGKIVSPLKSLPKGTEVTIYTLEKDLKINADKEFNDELRRNKDYVIKLTGENIEEQKINFSTRDISPNDSVQVEIVLGEVDTGNVFYIIYYDYRMKDIRSDASPELDRVVNYMKRRPEIIVELSAHTDSRGSFNYNMTLSKNRAIEAYNYIISKGIDKKRLGFKWFGEEQLVNVCKDGVNCSEEEHQKNRRTEFRVFKRTL